MTPSQNLEIANPKPPVDSFVGIGYRSAWAHC